MKTKLKNHDLIDWCAYCKEDILMEKGYVFYKNQYYHLYCYNQICGIDFADEENLTNENEEDDTRSET